MCWAGGAWGGRSCSRRSQKNEMSCANLWAGNLRLVLKSHDLHRMPIRPGILCSPSVLPAVLPACNSKLNATPGPGVTFNSICNRPGSKVVCTVRLPRILRQAYACGLTPSAASIVRPATSI